MDFKTLRFVFYITFILLFIKDVRSQQKISDTLGVSHIPYGHLYSSYTGLNADPIIFNDVSLNSYELLSANVQFSEDDDLQKLVIAPLKLIDIKNINSHFKSFLSNTKINLAQKDKISTLGLGFTWDNSLPNTKRGEEIGEEIVSESLAETAKIVNSKFADKIDQDLQKLEKKQLIYDLSDRMVTKMTNLRNYLLANLEVGIIGKEDPIKFSQNNCLDDDKPETCFGKDDYPYYKSLYDSYNKLYESTYKEVSVIPFQKALLENHFKVTFGGNISFFNILGSDDIDLDNDGSNDNEHSVKQRNLSLGVTWVIDECYGLSATAYLSEKRNASEQGNPFAPYHGFSASFGARSWTLRDYKDYKNSKDYLESLFVPSVHLGLSFEYERCNDDNSENCSENIQWQYNFTPYVEFKINPKNQFRLGIPISKVKQLNSKKEEIGPFLQWRLQLSGKS